MAEITYFVVVPFQETESGLVAEQGIQCPSERSAIAGPCRRCSASPPTAIAFRSRVHSRSRRSAASATSDRCRGTSICAAVQTTPPPATCCGMAAPACSTSSDRVASREVHAAAPRAGLARRVEGCAPSAVRRSPPSDRRRIAVANAGRRNAKTAVSWAATEAGNLQQPASFLLPRSALVHPSTPMQLHRMSAARSPSSGLIAPVGRSLLPVFAMFALAAAIAVAVWLCIYGVHRLVQVFAA